MKISKKIKQRGGVLLLGLALVACSSDNQKEENCFPEAAGQAFQEKAAAYTANPSKSTCLAAKAAALVYLEKLKDCPKVSSHITKIIEEWDDVDCNVFDELDNE
ncbi:hypothetical protein ACPDHL_08710 [Myroides sp. C15-4]|uniref:hypothetical protein n=1 Tax=Myroides sp. C15-4 TaxID=3400532 RepID=UPI003D2F5971